jgi:hypothetical protein
MSQSEPITMKNYRTLSAVDPDPQGFGLSA